MKTLKNKRMRKNQFPIIGLLVGIIGIIGIIYGILPGKNGFLSVVAIPLGVILVLLFSILGFYTKKKKEATTKDKQTSEEMQWKEQQKSLTGTKLVVKAHIDPDISVKGKSVAFAGYFTSVPETFKNQVKECMARRSKEEIKSLLRRFFLKIKYTGDYIIFPSLLFESFKGNSNKDTRIFSCDAFEIAFAFMHLREMFEKSNEEKFQVYFLWDTTPESDIQDKIVKSIMIENDPERKKFYLMYARDLSSISDPYWDKGNGQIIIKIPLV